MQDKQFFVLFYCHFFVMIRRKTKCYGGPCQFFSSVGRGMLMFCMHYYIDMLYQNGCNISVSTFPSQEDWLSKLHPFPDTPFPKELSVVAASYNLPQMPVLKLARIGSAQELGIAWNVDRKDPHVAEMDCYYIYVSHEHKNGTFSGWKCLGEIKAMPLPMACKVSDCKGDKRLCFIVVGKDIFGRYGPYSDIRTVASGQI